jgi:glycosyltransferase involved in cell wall biosynthesis
MKVAFNFLPYSGPSHGGAEVYLVSTLLSLQRSPGVQVAAFGARPSREITEAGITWITTPAWWSRNRATRIITEQILFPFLVRKHGVDCLVSNYVTPIFAKCPQVVVVHDMLYRRYPQALEKSKLAYWRLMIPASLLVSSSVMAVSEFSAQEINYFFPDCQEKVFVSGEGIRHSLISAGSSTTRMLETPYLLCVATFGEHKNLISLVNAFEAVKTSMPGLRIVFVGAARTPDAVTYRKKLQAVITSKGLESSIVFLNHVSDDELASLYTHAAALVLPSLYEGFGLPIIEAQHFHCPVICSTAASLPEISGGAAAAFDPSSTEGFRASIECVLQNIGYREQLIEHGLRNITRYSWDRTAVQLLNAVHHALENSRYRA